MSCINESELTSIYACIEKLLIRHQAIYHLDSSDLADIRQDSIVAWWQYTQSTKTRIPPKALARVIARRRLCDFIREQQRRGESRSDVDLCAVEPREPTLGADAILNEVHALPQDEATLVLKRLEGQTFQDIAREQRVHERTVRSRWTKAVSRLRQRLSSRLRQESGDRRLKQLACV